VLLWQKCKGVNLCIFHLCDNILTSCPSILLRAVTFFQLHRSHGQAPFHKVMAGAYIWLKMRTLGVGSPRSTSANHSRADRSRVCRNPSNLLLVHVVSAVHDRCNSVARWADCLLRVFRRRSGIAPAKSFRPGRDSYAPPPLGKARRPGGFPFF